MAVLISSQKSSRKGVDPVSGRPVRQPGERKQAYINRKRLWSRRMERVSSNKGMPTAAAFVRPPTGGPKRKLRNRERNRAGGSKGSGKRSAGRGRKPPIVTVVETRHVFKEPARITGVASRVGRASRIVRNLPFGVAYFSDVLLAGEARYRIWQNPDIKSLFDRVQEVFSSRPFALCGIAQVIALETVGPHFGLSDVIDVLAGDAMSSIVGDTDVLGVWAIYDESLTSRDMLSGWQQFGPAVVWLPLFYFAFNDLKWRGLWVAETSLEIASRFVLPLGVALTVVDVLRSLPAVMDTFMGRWALHADLFQPAHMKNSRPVPELVQELRRTRRVRADGSVTLTETISESVEWSGASTLATGARAVAGGVGVAVAAPVAVGVGLAAVGVAGGLALASTPFLAGYAAYKGWNGFEIPTSSWRVWNDSSKAMTRIDPSSARWRVPTGDGGESSIEVEELDSDDCGVSSSPQK